MGGLTRILHTPARRNAKEGGFVEISQTEVTLDIYIQKDEERGEISIMSGDYSALISVISGKGSRALALKILDDRKRVDYCFQTEGGVVEIWISQQQIRLITRIGDKKGEEVKFSTVRPNKERQELIALCMALHTEKNNP